MDIYDPLKSCKAYIESQFHETAPRRAGASNSLFITISRQAGAGGITIARLLARYLNRHDEKAPIPWTVFDRNLVAEVIRSHQLPAWTERFMTEQKISEFDDLLGEILKIHPAKWTLVRDTSQTILHLSELGHVILVGRGANLITRKQPGGLHVRLISSVEKRLKHLEQYFGFTPGKAAEFLKAEDGGRKNYIKHYFGKDIEDPLLYDLVINTDDVSYEEASRIIGRALLARTAKEKVAAERTGKDSLAEDTPY